MDEHPGDTLGKRFLTFWGALAAIVAVAVLLGLYRWIVIPSDSDANDGGAGKKRLELLTTTRIEQRKEMETAAEVEAGKSVRVPPGEVISYAAKALASQKAAASTIKTPAAIAAEAEAKAASGVHDPTVSEFEKK
jgi:hypothetical protein